MARSSIRLIVAAGLLLLLADVVVAEQAAELDLDGILGNGPDTTSVPLGTTVEVDVWLVGGDPLWGFQIMVCNADGNLQFESVVYNTSPSWTNFPPEFPSPNCVTITAADFTSDPLPQPDMVATMIYTAIVDHSLAELSVDKDSSSVLYQDIVPRQIEVSVDAFVQIGAIGTNQSTWGNVKTLFR